MKRPQKDKFAYEDAYLIAVNQYIDHIEKENKELKEALMETDLYYRDEVNLPNVRICRRNFNLIGKQ